MGTKETLINFMKVFIGSVGFLLTFYTMIELMYFLSYPNYPAKTLHSKGTWLSASWSCLVNMSLLSLFILHHSFLALPTIKERFNNWGLQSVCRSIYIISTTIVLLVLIKYWHDIPEVTLWKLNINFKPLLWIYTTVHVFAWLLIYVGSICMDVNELIGIKQIYYSIVNLPDPNLRKSVQLQRLTSHMRHPSFLAFLLIFWSFPVMSLDRVLLATILSVYMYISWNTDEIDYSYQYSQYTRKFYELEHLKS